MLTARFPRTLPTSVYGRAVDQLVESVFQDFPAFGVSTRRFPSMNAWEDANNLYIEAELPGFRIEDLEITLTGSELTISGTRNVANPEGATFYRRERPSGSFSRTVRIGTDVDGSKVNAALVNGVLTITLPKAEAVKPRKIDVKVK
jgi:HSP20 family protein